MDALKKSMQTRGQAKGQRCGAEAHGQVGAEAGSSTLAIEGAARRTKKCALIGVHRGNLQ
jgi:hypothetical protein